ncbi:inositol monophosphatase family protein [Streptomyces sp. BI20]|uniref:inositol monophosphatase family protein n=1 Tax=Streptomyces sp. BI20 TaxID=3403460 RepID=UPI003C73CA23
MTTTPTPPPPHTPPLSDVELAVAAARAGAAVIRSLYAREGPGGPAAGVPGTRIDKGDGDFAGAADLAAERAILDLLRRHRPQDAITGEESGSSGRAGARRRWLVDPLCGTLNYAARSPLVSVNVALREGGPGDSGLVRVAVCADPFQGEVFHTDGAGAFLRTDAGAELPLAPSGASTLVDVNLDPPFPNSPAFRAARLLDSAGFAARFRPRVISTTLAVPWVAAGRRAAYVTDGHLRDSVHFAAGIAVCEAAGCVVTNLAGGPVHTGAGGLIVAADPATHAGLLAAIADAGTSR